MTLERFLAILRSRSSVAFFVLLATVVLVAIASLTIPPRYRATATVVFDGRMADPIIGSLLGAVSTTGYMATAVDVMSSERVTRRVIQAMGLDKDLELIDEWREKTDGAGDFESWLCEKLQDKLTIKPSRESNVISLIYSASSPERAADFANAFVQAYIDTNVEMRVEPARQYRAMFDEQSRHLRDQLEVAQRALSSYQREKGLLATEERLDVENSRMLELSTQLVGAQSAHAEAAGRTGRSKASANSMSEVLRDPAVAELKTELARERRDYESMAVRLGDRHPQVAQARARIVEAESRMNSAVSQAASSVQVNSDAAQERVTQLQQQLTVQRAKVLQLKSMRDEAAVLQRDVENAQRAYDSMLDRANQSSVESQNNQTNVSLLKRATPAASPSFPRFGVNLVLSCFLGSLLAIMVVMFLEMRDRKLRTVSDVAYELKQPLLVVLGSSVASLGGGEPKRTRLLKSRIFPGLLGRT